jgi:uncharacterized protein (TIGR02099 family)
MTLTVLRPSVRASRGARLALRVALRVSLWAVAAVWSVLLLGWLTLYWVILPRIDEWRPQVETRAAAALGVPVAIGRIEVTSTGWVPVLTLREVRLFDRERQPALRLPQVTAALSARGLWHLLWSWRLQFEQLLLEDPELALRRDADGRWWVAGLPLQAGTGGDGNAAADWLFDQHEVVIRRGRLQWEDDATPGAAPLALDRVELVLRNRLRSHRLRLDASPVGFGERFTVRAAFQQPLWTAPGDWRRWNGTVHAELPQADLAPLAPYLPFRLIEGDGALRAWLDIVRGEPRGITVDLALHRMALQWPGAARPLGLAGVQGRFSAQQTDDGVRLAGQDLSFATDEGLQWPSSRFSVGWRRKPGQPLAGEASADRLSLPVLAELADRLPLGDALVQRLADWRPQGEAQGLQLRWDGPPEAPLRYQVQGRLQGLGLASAPAAQAGDFGRPGLEGVDLELKATERGGEARLLVDDGGIRLPGVFAPERLALQRVTADLDWRLDRRPQGPPGIELRLRQARIANDDLSAEFSGTWRNPVLASGGREVHGPGWLQLDGRLSQARAEALARYLPLGVADARRYVAQAVQSGRIDGATLRLRGPLARFPFANPKEGDFRIEARVSDVTLAYVPPDAPGAALAWPAFQRLSGELVFEREGMEIRNAAARLWGLELKPVKGAIRRLHPHPVLEVDGQVRGPLADLLRYVNGTPLADWSGQALKGATASGPATLNLALALPLDDLDRSTVKGSLVLAGNELRPVPEAPVFSQARGRVDFTHKGFSVVGASARALGGEVTFEGGSTPDGALRFVGQGTATADGLRRANELPALQRLGAVAGGQAAYRLQLNVLRGLPEFSLTSTLAGLALDLPAPLGKRAESTLPLRVQTVLAPDAAAGATSARETLRIDLGTVAQAVVQRDPKAASPVLRSAFAIGEPLPAPQPGGVAAVSLPRLDADAWSTALDRLTPAGPAAAGAALGAAVEAAAWLPRQVNLKLGTLVAGGRQIDRLNASVSPLPDGGWRLAGSAAQGAGTVEYRPPAAGAAAAGGRLSARLSRLALNESDAQPTGTGPAGAATAPRSLPALDVVVDEFALHGLPLGRLQIDASNRAEDAASGAGADWMARFTLANPEGRLAGSGHWLPAGSANRRGVALDFTLDITDAGGLLKRLGIEDALRGGKGRLQGQAGWNGTPLALDVPSLDGSLQLALENGQFLKAGPGAARLLGVLSLQSLPRRLTLDFRDLFQQGFAFDKVDGDVKIERGVASTNNLRMRGVQAAVLMEGQADLGRETQDLRVVVVPEINAGTASLAYAVINPAIGLGTFMAQWLLRRPLMAAGTREFHIHGSWDDPKVDRVARRGEDAAAEPDPHTAPPLASENPR